MANYAAAMQLAGGRAEPRTHGSWLPSHSSFSAIMLCALKSQQCSSANVQSLIEISAGLATHSLSP